MIRSSLTVLLLSTLMFSCKKRTDPAPSSTNNSNVSRPEFLEEGTEYGFTYTSFLDDASVLSKVYKEVAKDTLEIRNYTDSDSYPGKYFIAWNNGSLYSSIRLRDKGNYQKICDFTAAVGTSWTGKYGKYSVEGHNTQVKTPYGDINDVTKIKYVQTGSTSPSYSYYSLKYGIIGQGYESSDDMTTKLYLKTVKMGTKNVSPAATIPAITYGNFGFFKVGAQWKYAAQVGLGGEEDTMTLNIKSKLGTNIYEVAIKFQSESTVLTQYWYEDAGQLMIYNAGETAKQADIAYSKVAQANDGWVGIDDETTFFYKVKELNYVHTSTLYPDGISTTSVYVSSGLFSTQTNYWNENVGQTGVDGFGIYLDLLSTKNLRKEHKSHPLTVYGGM